MSRAQIREDAEKREVIARGKDPAAKTEVPLEENVNRVEAETATARTVDEKAFSNLRISDTPEIEKHPESQDAHSKKKN